MKTEPGTWEHGQKVCFIALRRKGWEVSPSRIGGNGYWQAVNVQRGDTVVAKDFRTLLDKAAERDAEAAKKQREAKAKEA